MTTLIAVSKSEHLLARWVKYSSFSFAAAQAVVPLVAQELPRAAGAFPVGFVREADAFVPVAVMGLEQGQNRFVAADGRWAGRYIPAAYRGCPFTLATAPSGDAVLCFDQDSGLVGDKPNGERLFDDEGQMSEGLKGILDFLVKVRQNRAATQNICAVLEKRQLIKPWPIKIAGPEGERILEGLYMIDEGAVNALSGEALEEVHLAGALPVIYCQLLSMQNLQSLTNMSAARAQVKPGPALTASGELDFDRINMDAAIDFSRFN